MYTKQNIKIKREVLVINKKIVPIYYLKCDKRIRSNTNNILWLINKAKIIEQKKKKNAKNLFLYSIIELFFFM